MTASQVGGSGGGRESSQKSESRARSECWAIGSWENPVCSGGSKTNSRTSECKPFPTCFPAGSGRFPGRFTPRPPCTSPSLPPPRANKNRDILAGPGCPGRGRAQARLQHPSCLDVRDQGACCGARQVGTVMVRQKILDIGNALEIDFLLAHDRGSSI
jgi:hypothetical protein